MTRLLLLPVLLLTLLYGCGQDQYRRPDAESYFSEGQSALVKKDCFKAQQLFRNLLSDFPGSHYVDDAQYGLAQAYFCSDDYIEATFEFERLINEYPVSPFVDQARYQIGMCYFKQSRSIHHDQDETLRAIAEFERFAEDFPESELATEARNRIRDLRAKLAKKHLMIAENYLKWREPRAAVIYAEEVLLQYPESAEIHRARLVMALGKYKMGELDDALAILEELARLDIGDDLRAEVSEALSKVRKTIADRGGEPAVPGGAGQAATMPSVDR